MTMASTISVEFCGEWYRVAEGEELTIGREADLNVDDDNPFLHRRFLTIVQVESMWWLVNIGARLSATITDGTGSMQAWLAPGASRYSPCRRWPAYSACQRPARAVSPVLLRVQAGATNCSWLKKVSSPQTTASGRQAARTTATPVPISSMPCWRSVIPTRKPRWR